MDSPLFRKPKKPKKKKMRLPGLLGACINKCQDNSNGDENVEKTCIEKCKYEETARKAKSEYLQAKSNLEN